MINTFYRKKTSLPIDCNCGNLKSVPTIGTSNGECCTHSDHCCTLTEPVVACIQYPDWSNQFNFRFFCNGNLSSPRNCSISYMAKPKCRGILFVL